MRVFFLIIFAIALLLQDSQPTLRQLFEKLGSDSIGERERASVAIIRLGRSAEQELRSLASASNDLEVRHRALSIQRHWEFDGLLSAEFKRAIPTAVRRLVVGDSKAWTKLFMEGLSLRSGEGACSTDEDLEKLAANALSGCRTRQERDRVCQEIVERSFHTCGGTLIDLLGDEDSEVAECALTTLVRLGQKDYAGQLAERIRMPLVERLVHPRPRARGAAAFALAVLKMKGEAHRLLPLLGDSDEHVRCHALVALHQLGARELLNYVVPLLADGTSSIRQNARRVLLHLGAEEVVHDIARHLVDKRAEIRAETAGLMGSVDSLSAVSSLRELLTDSDTSVRVAAAGAISFHGNSDGVALLLSAGSSTRPPSLNCLNFLRQPTFSHTLKFHKLGTRPSTFRFTLKDYLEELTGCTIDASSLDLQLSHVNLEIGSIDPSVLRGFDVEIGPPSVPLNNDPWSQLEFQCVANQRQFILQSNSTIRIVTYKEALRFWTEWSQAGK